MVNQVTLSADSAAERQYLPSPEELVDELLLADRGYYSKHYLRACRDVHAHRGQMHPSRPR